MAQSIADLDQDKYRKFVIKQLQIAKINREYRELFTDSEGMKLFIKAVTHPTENATENYEVLEFIGDGILKGVLSQYIPRRFPNVKVKGKKNVKAPGEKDTSEGVLSEIRRQLEQRQNLSTIANELGFWEFVLADEHVKTTKRKEGLEDVYEAFIGALVEIVDTRVKVGLGYNYAYNYITASLDNIKIELTESKLRSAVTRLNELYKTNDIQPAGIPPLKWGDAIYQDETLFIPRMDTLPSNATSGDLIFYTRENRGVPMVFTGTEWVSAYDLPPPPLTLRPYPLYNGVNTTLWSPEEKLAKLQRFFHVWVYGFPSFIGKPIGKLQKQGILREELFGQEDRYKMIIGQGLGFKKTKGGGTDAKEKAATAALQWLKTNYGIE